MQQFQVPKFIDLEEKILASLTLPQTLTVVGAGAVIVGLYFILESFLFFPVAIIISIVTLVLAFVRVNEKPFADFFMNFLTFTVSPRVYVWTRAPQKQAETPTKIKKEVGQFARPGASVTREQIQQLAQRIDKK
ncbi:MAG: PrgI family protein [Candidatus Spechtbacteria bacterium]|nr:PrgI family protein [Candidatus Spechtbacteria bacterium]